MQTHSKFNIGKLDEQPSTTQVYQLTDDSYDP